MIFGWYKYPLPSYVTAHWKLWWLWFIQGYDYEEIVNDGNHNNPTIL